MVEGEKLKVNASSKELGIELAARPIHHDGSTGIVDGDGLKASGGSVPAGRNYGLDAIHFAEDAKSLVEGKSVGRLDGDVTVGGDDRKGHGCDWIWLVDYRTNGRDSVADETDHELSAGGKQVFSAGIKKDSFLFIYYTLVNRYLTHDFIFKNLLF